MNRDGERKPFIKRTEAATKRASTPAQRALVDGASRAGYSVVWDGELAVPAHIRGADLSKRQSFSSGRGLAVSGRGRYAEDAVAVMDNLAGLYRISDAAQEFSARKTEGDALGFHHVRLQQKYRGLPVVGGEVTVHFNKSGQAYQANGRYVPDLAVGTAPAQTAAQALAAAQADLRARKKPAGAPVAVPALVVYARGGPARLAYELTLIYQDPRAGAGRWRYWVDAADGSVLQCFNDIESIPAPSGTGSAAVITGSLLAGENGAITNVLAWYDSINTNFYLSSTGRMWIVENVAASGYPDANTFAYRATNDWGTSDRVEISTARNFDLTLEYYRERHALFSFNGAGAIVRANVHQGVNYVNAYWDGSEFYFGDGNGSVANSLAVLDVCGHEFTHAVTEYSANLVYANEPGALNESFSDVMGSCVEFFGQADDRATYPARTAGAADWLCGEDCWLSSTALRDLRNPANSATVGAGNEQPTRYQGTYWDFAQEVHQNSGVQNFFFYLLCEGGSGNNDGISYSVTGIGITNAERVAFRALTVYCTANTGYREVRSAWLSAALDLNPAWAGPVGAAWDAVGIQAVSISPAGGASFSGSEGGPFSPTTMVYTVANADSSAIGWGISHTQAWVNIAPAGGSIPAFGSQVVTVSLDGAASALPAGSYADSLIFTNSASSASDSRPATLQVIPPAIYCDSLDVQPGWTTEGEWAFGTPTGSGGALHGYPDPAGGASGTKVFGVNLAGDYSTTPGGPYYLTAGPFDFSAFTNVSVTFQRWLNTDFQPYAGASIEGSSNGTDWIQVWVNPTGVEIADSAWTMISHNLSAQADSRSSFYLRWAYQINNQAYPYSGWNIDDVCFYGQPLDALRVTPGTGLSSSGYEGGPFAPTGKTFQVVNGGTNALTWSASTTDTWLSVSSPGGYLSAGATATVSAALTPAADAFTPGAYPGTVVFSNANTGVKSTRVVTLTVLAIPGEIGVEDSIAPASDLSLPFGDVIIGLARTESITVTNADLTYPVLLSQLALSGGAFSLANGPAGFPYAVGVQSSLTFNVTYTPAAAVSNDGEVVIHSNDADEPQVHVLLSGRGIPDYLQVSPATGLASRGHPGGPFAPDRAVYVLTNTSGGAISWTAVHTQGWISAAPSSGALGAGEAQSVTVSVNGAANALGEGGYGDTVVFSNVTTGIRVTRTAALTVFTSPQIGVTPTELWVTNRMGQSQTNVLTVSNGVLADGTLTFRLLSRSTGQAPLPFRGAARASQVQPGHNFAKAAAGADFVPGELLVRFDAGVAGAARTALLATLGGGTVRREYRLVSGLALVRLPPTLTVQDALATFNGAPGILYAEPNYVVHAFDTTPDDARFSELWGMHNTGQTGGTPDADIDAPAAWDAQTGSTNIIVCVIDTGIDYGHEDLAGNLWHNPGEIAGNLLDDDGNGYTDDVHGINAILMNGDPRDDHDHGTHCSGTIGGFGNNGVGVAGVSWRVSLMGAKFLDSSGNGNTADAITCVDYAAAKGAKVLSNSWGGGGYSQGMKDAIDAANAAEILFIAAAGNAGSDNDATPNYPSGYSSSNVVAVLSTDHNDAKSDFSSYGQTTVDLAAPGSSILSCKRGGGYQLMSGTSMATPHVAGASALLLAANPLATAAEVKQAMMGTVDVLFPTLCLSGGRLNLPRALAEMSLAWLTLNPLAVMNVPAGFSTNIQVGFHAGSLEPAIYHGEILVSGNDVTNPVVTVPVHMTILRDDLGISPATVFTSSGIFGGPFSPSASVYLVSNAGPSSVTWTLAHTGAWLSVSSSGGTLAPAAVGAVTVSVNASANSLAVGSYVDTPAFSNSLSGVVQRRTAQLTVDPVPLVVIHAFPLDANPGWTTEGQWAFGVPQGLGGDPASGFTGTNVYGYNLDGTYPNNMPIHALTTPALSCAGFTDVSLSFRRWLGVESATWDHAAVQVSSNGLTWVTVWSHTGGTFQDNSWQAVSYDISAVANGQSTLYVRWQMGTTDSSLTYSGWNLDDIQILGRPSDADSDHDGMDDSWEAQHGLDVGVNDATNNPDNDAWSNGQEYIADLNPLLSNAPLGVAFQFPAGALGIQVGPVTTNSRLYDFQLSTNLLDPSWTIIQSNVPGAADGGALLLGFTNAAPQGAVRADVHLP